MAKTLTQGTVLSVAAVAVGNLTSITPPGATKPEIDVSDFDSTAAEFLMGMPDSGEMSFSGFFNKANAAQMTLLDDAVATTAVSRAFTILFPLQGTFAFNGYVKSFVPTGSGTNAAITFDGSVRVTGPVTWTPAV